MFVLNTTMVVSGLLDGLIAIAILCLGSPSTADGATTNGSRRRWPIQLPDAVVAGLAGGAALSVKLLIFRFFGLDLFGLIRLTYFDCVVVLPLVGTAVLIHRAVRPAGATGPGATLGVTAIAMLTLLAAPLGYYASFIEPFDLRTERPEVTLTALPPETEPIVVAVLADIQSPTVDDHVREAIDAVVNAEPDLIVIPGDIYEMSQTGPVPEHVADFRAQFSRLHAPAGVFFVNGDCDHADVLDELLRDTDVRRLDNEVVDTVCNGVPLRIAGLSLHTHTAAARAAYRNLADGPTHAIRIVLSHRPAAVARCLTEGTRPDLAIAGHTHGGQVCIPGYGPIITLSALPRENASGLSRYEGVPLYVSRGIGYEGGQAPRLRLCCPPEVTLLSLIAPATKPPTLARR
jgi:hypothetical protein